MIVLQPLAEGACRSGDIGHEWCLHLVPDKAVFIFVLTAEAVGYKVADLLLVGEDADMVSLLLRR